MKSLARTAIKLKDKGVNEHKHEVIIEHSTYDHQDLVRKLNDLEISLQTYQYAYTWENIVKHRLMLCLLLTHQNVVGSLRSLAKAAVWGMYAHNIDTICRLSEIDLPRCLLIELIDGAMIKLVRHTTDSNILPKETPPFTCRLSIFFGVEDACRKHRLRLATLQVEDLLKIKNEISYETFQNLLIQILFRRFTTCIRLSSEYDT